MKIKFTICTQISPDFFNYKKLGETLSLGIIINEDTSSFLIQKTFDNTIDCVDYIDKVCISHLNIIVKKNCLSTNVKIL